MLGSVHWLGGYDGRDDEFNMGGPSFSGVVTNPFHRRSNYKPFPKVSLVEEEAWGSATRRGYFINDPYYPRSRPLPGNNPALARDFLRAIEAKRDTISECLSPLFFIIDALNKGQSPSFFSWKSFQLYLY